MPNLPSGTVTFLFTDIEGSTRLLQQQGQRYGSLLTAYRDLLRSLFQTHSGQEVDTQGDSFLVVFGRAVDAVAAAVAIQRALASYSWPAGVSMATRMGVHTGEPQLQPGGYVGLDVHRAARLMAAGHGGQVLLSQATYGLVRHELPAGVILRDLGEHRLKDLQHPERISQLVIPDLPADFPALKTLGSRRYNLPTQPTALIGREQEVARVLQLLQQPTVRLVTLTGPGGTGKTRLALQVAAELLDAFMHGVYFVNLAPIGDPSLVASAIAQTLGIIETGDQPLPERIQSYLRDKQLLLVLDNFEQIVDAAPLIAALLAGCPQLKILVTSRVPLHLRGEKEVSVPPLALPDLHQLPAVESLTQYAAVELFIQRALDVQPDFAVTNDNAPAVAEICYRLDGLPLAIELAAARLKLFSPEALLARLSNRLTLLTGGARDLPQRQQTLRNAISWSYDLLDADMQTLFARLGVFVGGCTPDAVAAVCKGIGDRALDVLDGLALLADSSLLRRDEDANGEPRFVMLETIREYALERLEASGEAEHVRQQHAAYYLTLARAAGAIRLSKEKVAAEQLAQEHANLLAALTWSQTSDDAGLGVRLVDSLRWFWHMRGEWVQLREWLRNILLQPPAAEALTDRARRLELAADLAVLDVADVGQAQTLLEESLVLYRAVGDKAGCARSLLELGFFAHDAGDFPRARQLHSESLALVRDLGDKEQLAGVLHQLGDLAREDGDYPRAAALLAESLAVRRELGNTSGIASVLNGMGDLALYQGNQAQARALYHEARGLLQEIGHRFLLANVLRNLGRVAHMQGDNKQARALLRESLALFRQHGWMYGIGACLDAFAGVIGTQGQPERAARLFGAGLALRQTSPDNAWSWPVGARFDYEQDVAHAGAQLDAATFAAAWAAGQAMTLEQAIADALGAGD